MMNCPNCKAELSCGCQQRVAPNNQMCCIHCISEYTNKLNAPQQLENLDYGGVKIQEALQNGQTAPVITSITSKYNNYNQ